ncbi:polyprenyl synthetase family protein [Jatrophihabitans telluris]|uniref:Polyprenyl synthetase family protein n=1 Tax=Jatrophihabitans telluris TaxID=2038343 RepID=A0ABY4QVZ8_9ACTN|nr:polyprenyl synthetase family protein [Jatrophihabitans telluris]UQX87216.1 polyprenyl synthetase family protein [Jatrophihabitans telluris]
MSSSQPTPGPAPSVLERINSALSEFLDHQRHTLLDIHPDLSLLADAAESAVMAGGKRLRPTFAYWGWRSARPAGSPGEHELFRAAASLELLQACALVHDDLMDDSDTRRGQPAAHVRFASEHTRAGWPGPAGRFGLSGAVLLGDLLLSWAEELFDSAQEAAAAAGAVAAEHARACRREFDAMRTEVVAGQFLDVLAQTRAGFDVQEALRVIEFKTTKYTIQRPLLLGARAAGAPAELTHSLAEYGYALGEAFQLRDDLLGVFGDPVETGKPAGDDLREGKRTYLLAVAMQRADEQQATLLRQQIGDPKLEAADVEQLRELLVATNAVADVEARISDRAAAAEQILSRSSISREARAALSALAQAAAHRTF